MRRIEQMTERRTRLRMRTRANPGTKPGAKPVSILSKALALFITLSLLSGSLYGCGTVGLLILWNLKGPPDIVYVPPVIEIPVFVGEPRSVEEIADDLYEFILMQDYSIYNQLVANPEAFGITAPEPRFWDVSYEGACEEHTYYRELLSELYACDRSVLNAKEGRLYDYLLFFLEGAHGVSPELFFYFDDPYAPSMGMHISAPLSLTVFSFRTKKDIDAYLDLVADIPRALAQADAVARERMRQGIIPNRSAIESTIDEAKTYVTTLSRNLLVTSFENALNSNTGPFASLTPAERNQYAATNRNLIETKVIPAYRNTISLLEEIASKAKDTTTIASMPYYKEYYAARMRAQGFAITPEEAIVLLDATLEDYSDELYYSSSILGFNDWDRIARKNLPTGAADIIKYFNTRVSEDFPDIGIRPFVVDAASDDEVIEKFTAFYLLAAVDDLTENRIVFYPQNISDHFDLATTLAHEAFPGHLYQYNYFGLTQQPHPLEMLIGATAYEEGYAVYSQFYALRYIGLSTIDADFANTYELYLRALQARLDLGINYEGWDLRKTEAFLSDWGLSGYGSVLFGDTASTPLLMLPYGLGPIEFYTLLSTAKDELGSAFDLKAFHKAILDNGALPFWLLEENFNAWLNN